MSYSFRGSRVLSDALYDCVACSATGVSSKGGTCAPCKGTGACGWVSPSQLKQFVSCELKWWFQYVAGAPRQPTTPAQAGGIRVHGQLEAKVKTGAAITDPIAARIYSHLPTATMIALPGRPGIAGTDGAEVGATVLIDRIGFYCVADLVRDTVIYDYKTSSNPRKYALTPEELPLDVQAVILAHAFPYAQYLAWVYASTRTSVSFPVYASAVDARANAARVTVPADRLIRVRTGKQMPGYNLDNCFAYGQPCPHIPYCPAKELPSRNPFETEDNMATIDPARLEAARARLAANGTLPAMAAAAPAPAQSALQKARAAMAAAATEADAIAEAIDEEAEIMAALEAEEAAAHAATAPAQSALEKARAAVAARAAAKADAQTPQSQKTKVLAPLGSTVASSTGDTFRPDPESVVKKTIGVLYIDCIPDTGVDGETCVDAHDVIESAHGRVRRAHDVPHYAAMPYGQGKPALEMAIAEVLLERGADAMVAVRVDVGLPALIRASSAIVRALA